MARLYLVRLTEEGTKTLFRIDEFAAGCAVVLLLLAALFAPYALGFAPDAEVALFGEVLQ